MDLKSMSDNQLLEHYIDTAIRHRIALIDGSQSEKANSLYKRLIQSYREIRFRGEIVENKFIELLKYPDVRVRSWAAAHIMDFKPDLAEPVLKDLIQADIPFISLSAEYLLREWQAGKLKFPEY